MNDLQLTFWTVLSGVLVLTIGQIIIKFLIEPFQKYRETVGEIGVAIIDYGRTAITVPNPDLSEAQKKANESFSRAEDELNLEYSRNARQVFRHLAGQLASSANAIPFHNFWAIVRLLPPEQDVKKATNCLIGMANSMHSSSHLTEYKGGISKSLGLKIMPG